MFVASCPLRVSLFGGSTDNPYFVEKYGTGAVISFTSSLKVYATISQDKIGFNKEGNKYIINYSKREEVSSVDDIENEVVRVVLKHFNMPPVQVTLTSDVYSQGSGLASSSAYTISLIKACCLFLGGDITDSSACKLAFELERQYNPYCGYQDPYGCGVGGFKLMNFTTSAVTYEFLSTDVFQIYDMHLVFTGITRNSREVLQSVTKNLDKVKPLLETTNRAYDALERKDYGAFLKLLNTGWEEKKRTSSQIANNNTIVEMDEKLSKNPTVVAHKLCGAGNGGFFLLFSKKNTLDVPYNKVKINVEPKGVYGELI